LLFANIKAKSKKMKPQQILLISDSPLITPWIC
jgi:hypothetical protein